MGAAGSVVESRVEAAVTAAGLPAYRDALLEKKDALAAAAEGLRPGAAQVEERLKLALNSCGVEDAAHQDKLVAALRANGGAYVPQPKDTSNVILPDHLAELTEKLAENAHECWAAQRISQGWVWGAERNDSLKHHPCLITYEELSEEEKEYDRVTAMNTIKLLLAFGYKIVPPTPTQVSARAPKDPSAIEGDSSGDLAPDDNSTEQEGVAEAAG